jgi:hypothetical protein
MAHATTSLSEQSGSNIDVLSPEGAASAPEIRTIEVPNFDIGILYSKFFEQKRDAPGAPRFVEMCSPQITLTSRALASTLASLPRIKARRIGLIKNSAIRAAVALSATAMMNTACQP